MTTQSAFSSIIGRMSKNGPLFNRLHGQIARDARKTICARRRRQKRPDNPIPTRLANEDNAPPHSFPPPSQSSMPDNVRRHQFGITGPPAMGRASPCPLRHSSFDSRHPSFRSALPSSPPKKPRQPFNFHLEIHLQIHTISILMYITPQAQPCRVGQVNHLRNPLIYR